MNLEHFKDQSTVGDTFLGKRQFKTVNPNFLGDKGIDWRLTNAGRFTQLPKCRFAEHPKIWLANHTHVTGPAFYDTANGSDFFPAA